MRDITFKLFLSLMLFLGFQQGFGQVTGISYTISPTVEYVRWSDKAALNDGFLVGGKLGLAFGQFLELRGSYMQSINLETDFSDFGIANFSDNLFSASPVKLTRWGGELKANITKGKLLPYITFGTGVQSIELDKEEAFKQIYLNLGVGIKLSLADRYTLALGVKNTQYSYNSGKNLLTDMDKTALNVQDADFSSEKLRNWSALASLEFYLGGRRPDEMTELDKIYMSSFSDGFRSLRGTIEPMVGKINFSDDLPYRNTNLAGANIGLDFGQYIGVRGFYWRALEDGKATSFDDLALYGGELRFKLNTQGGIIPYVILGGGNIDVRNKYEGKSIELNDSTLVTLNGEDKGFAMGGIGILLPISRSINIFGSARVLLTSAGVLEDTEAPDDIKTNRMYSAGFRINFGKKSEDPNKIIQANMNDALARQQNLDSVKTAELKSQYEEKMTGLEIQLNEAYLAQDAKKAADIAQQKEKTQTEIDKIDRQQVQDMQPIQLPTTPVPLPNNSASVPASKGEIRMSPAEFQSLVSAILDGMNNTTSDGSNNSTNSNRNNNSNSPDNSSNSNSPDKNNNSSSNSSSTNNDAPTATQTNQVDAKVNTSEKPMKEQELNKRLEEIQKDIVAMQEKMTTQGSNMSPEMKKDLEESARKMLQEIRILEQRIILNGKKNDALNEQSQTTEKEGMKDKDQNNVPTGQN